ncbi:hypothetical protein B0H67DRAFT_193519 [Lasiosphaeris hirsuta]|uniref:Uncharacterized protein n=1 Tax=Lasiosphaeris hirsuta TaxID=260670 RepID=A0AA40DXX4_9PEZI|nr:hypothetical protein B0H67DRAFT_193519 [Lasiosphaeris hirsuta]
MLAVTTHISALLQPAGRTGRHTGLPITTGSSILDRLGIFLKSDAIGGRQIGSGQLPLLEPSTRKRCTATERVPNYTDKPTGKQQKSLTCVAIAVPGNGSAQGECCCPTFMSDKTQVLGTCRHPRHLHTSTTHIYPRKRLIEGFGTEAEKNKVTCIKHSYLIYASSEMIRRAVALQVVCLVTMEGGEDVEVLLDGFWGTVPRVVVSFRPRFGVPDKTPTFRGENDQHHSRTAGTTGSPVVCSNCTTSTPIAPQH